MNIDRTHWRRFAKNHRSIWREPSGAKCIYAGSFMNVYINDKMKDLDNKMGEVTLAILVNDKWELVEGRPIR